MVTGDDCGDKNSDEYDERQTSSAVCWDKEDDVMESSDIHGEPSSVCGD